MIPQAERNGYQRKQPHSLCSPSPDRCCGLSLSRPTAFQFPAAIRTVAFRGQWKGQPRMDQNFPSGSDRWREGAGDGWEPSRVTASRSPPTPSLSPAGSSRAWKGRGGSGDRLGAPKVCMAGPASSTRSLESVLETSELW